MYEKNYKPLQRSYKSSFFSNKLLEIDNLKIVLDENMEVEFKELLKINSIYVKFESDFDLVKPIFKDLLNEDKKKYKEINNSEGDLNIINNN